MAKLLFRPTRDGYSAQRGQEVLAVQLDGGASRFRRDILNAPFRVTTSWQCNPEQYNYLNAFYRTATEHGSSPFEIDLFLDNADYVEYTAKFIPASFKLDSQSGLTYYVSAELEVEKPFDPDEATDDAATILAYETEYPEGE